MACVITSLFLLLSCKMFRIDDAWGTSIGVIVFVIVGMATIAISLGLVYRRRSGRATTTASLKGKTVLITGASSGMPKVCSHEISVKLMKIFYGFFKIYAVLPSIKEGSLSITL